MERDVEVYIKPLLDLVISQWEENKAVDFSPDVDVLQKVLDRFLSILFSESFEKKGFKKLRFLGRWIYKLGIPDILLEKLYLSIKHQMEENHVEGIERLEKAFRALLSSYIKNYIDPLKKNAERIYTNDLSIIKNIEKAIEAHYDYLKKFFEAVFDEKPFELPLSPDECRFTQYIANLESLRKGRLYNSILYYHKAFHLAVQRVFSIKNSSFIDLYASIKEVERYSNRLLEDIYSLLVDLLSSVAVHDPLTQVFNRNYLDYALEREINRSLRYNTHVCLIIIDIDNFKIINDTYGHIVGDEVLKNVAYVLKRFTRSTDVVIRYGGEEFLIILPHTDLEGAKTVAEKLRTYIKEHAINIGNIRLNTTVSCGVVMVKNLHDPFEDIDRADRAMYMAKRLGKDRVYVLEDG